MAEQTSTASPMGGALKGLTVAQPNIPDDKKASSTTSASQAPQVTSQPTQTVQYGLTRYSPSQKFEVTPSGEVKVVPLAGGKEGGVLYQDLPKTAQIALEQKGIISGSTATQGFGSPVVGPTGKIYTGTGFAAAPTGGIASRFLVTEPSQALPSTAAGITAGSALDTATKQLAEPPQLNVPLAPQQASVSLTPLSTLPTTSQAALLTTPQGIKSPDEAKKSSLSITGTAAAAKPKGLIEEYVSKVQAGLAKPKEPVPEPTVQLPKGTEIGEGAFDINKALSRITGAEETTPAVTLPFTSISPVSITTATPKAPTAGELKVKDVVVRPPESQTPVKATGDKVFLRAETATGDVRFVPVPFTEDQFVKESVKVQPFEQFKTTSLQDAGTYYDKSLEQINAKGEVPTQSKAEYLSSFEKTLTPDYQKQLIKDQFTQKAYEFVTTKGADLPAITRSQLGSIEKEEQMTQFFKEQIQAGNVPPLAEAATLAYVAPTSQALAAGIAKGIGATGAAQELQSAALESEARTFAKASIAGQKGIAGELGFGIESIPETFTGIAGTSILGGEIAGAGLKAALPYIGKAGTAISESALAGKGAGIGEKIYEFSVLHPTATRVAVGSIPFGLESATIYGRAVSGEPLPQIVSETAKEATGLAGFTLGFHEGFQKGFPLKYVKAEVPIGEEAAKAVKAGEEVTPTRLGAGLELETGGKSRFIFSKTEEAAGGTGKFKLGGPEFTSAPEGTLASRYLPSSAGEAEIVKAAYSAEGGSPLEVAKMSAVQGIMKATAGGPAPIKPEEFKLESRYIDQLVDSGKITETQAQQMKDVITDVTQKYAKKYIELYGSQSQYLQQTKEIGRTPADVDITARLNEQNTVGLAAQIKNDVATGFKEAGVSAKIAKVVVDEDNPKLIQLVVQGEQPHHLFDIHSAFEPQPDIIQKSSYGYSLEPETFKLEGVPVSKLAKEAVRKASSVGELQPIGQSAVQGAEGTAFEVGPLAHRAKDISDVTRLAKSIELGYSQVGKTAEAGKISQAVGTYVSIFGKQAVPISEVTAEPLVAVRSAVSGLSSAGIGSAIASLTSAPSSAFASASESLKPIKVVSAPSRPSYPSVSASPSGLVSSRVSAASEAPQSISYPSSSSFRSSLKSLSPSSYSPPSSYSAPSGSYPSVSSSRPPSVSPPPSPSLSSPSSKSSAVSSAASSLSSASSSASMSLSLASLGTGRGQVGGGGAKGEEAKKKPMKYRKIKSPPSKEYVGILSEGISKELFGKATLGRKKVPRYASSPTAELQKAGITSPAAFLERGGFVTQGKRSKEIGSSVGAIFGGSSELKKVASKQSFSKVRLE